MQVTAAAGEKKGCLLVQFPPSLQASAFPQLQELVLQLNSYDWPIAIEFRHSRWYNDKIYDFLNKQENRTGDPGHAQIRYTG